jgi:SAM-dependent methyltransferase
VGAFERYAHYYDACYGEKDYDGECDFIEAAFARFGGRPRSLLDLACGTGNHGLRLAARGYEVGGVDRAPAMLSRYRLKAESLGLTVDLHEQDLRTLDLGRGFDAALCMFDAIGYLPTNADLSQCLARVRHHVRPGGLFLFDFWHAAAVLRGHEPVRVREFRMPGRRILRISTTALDVGRQLANVTFRILAFEGCRLVDDFTELHAMRYFLGEEIRFILETTGWTPRHVCPAFDLDGAVDAEAWHLVAIATPAGS